MLIGLFSYVHIYSQAKETFIAGQQRDYPSIGLLIYTRMYIYINSDLIEPLPVFIYIYLYKLYKY